MDNRISKPHEENVALRDPSKIVFQADSIRRIILASYWIVIFLALPLWWHTTSIERLSLPSSLIYAQADRDLRFPVHIVLSGSRDASQVAQLQHALSERALQSLQRWRGLELIVDSDDRSNHNTGHAYVVTFADDDLVLHDRQVSLRNGSTSDLADILAALIVPYTSVLEQEYRATQFAPHYRLAFTLLNEDAAAGPFMHGWDVSGAISRHISPLMASLSWLHNFTVESQVQFQAPLAFKPRYLHDGTYGLTPEDLTVFVNSAEWTLSSSVSNDPVLHFIIFVPSSSRQPLYILDAHGDVSGSNAFLVPQWGGIVLYNPPIDTASSTRLSAASLDPIFSAFSQQLLALLGAPSLPSGARISEAESTSVLTKWQLDALLRRRVLENVRGSQDTLQSIVKLVDQIENMPVGQSVKGDVQDSVAALEKTYDATLTSLPLALNHSANALTLASRAFFNPGMLALLYFPAEHKYAVYTPLFASAVIPLVGAALREIMAERRRRRSLKTLGVATAATDHQKADRGM